MKEYLRTSFLVASKLNKVHLLDLSPVLYAFKWKLSKLVKTPLVVTAQKCFPKRISSVNVAKSAGNCELGHI